MRLVPITMCAILGACTAAPKRPSVQEYLQEARERDAAHREELRNLAESYRSEWSIKEDARLEHLAAHGHPAVFPEVKIGVPVQPIFDAIEAINQDELCWGKISATGETTTVYGRAVSFEMTNREPFKTTYSWHRADGPTSYHIIAYDTDGRVVSYSHN